MGRAPIFVVEEVHVMMLHRQSCLVDPARVMGGYFELAVTWSLGCKRCQERGQKDAEYSNCCVCYPRMLNDGSLGGVLAICDS